MDIYCWLYGYLLLAFIGIVIFGWVIKHEQLMVYFSGVFIGVISCLFVVEETIDLVPKDLIAIVKECEKDIPYIQHCEVVVTAKVVDNG